MKTRAALLVLCLPVVAWLPAAHAGAAAPDSRVAPGPAAATNSAVTMDQAVRMVERRFHARVVKAETERDNGRTVYVLRLLNDAGKVWTVRVDARDGVVQ
ncbi:MAG: hypothetical protein E6K24_05175 [Gammaproteobacteria bacterium]|nr:MAG: hypothetical protein E6K24_05175 [Gammaproteobacteria bacterium]